MGRILTLPLRRKRVHGVFQDEQAPALLRREVQLVRCRAPTPAAQLVLGRALEALAQQRSGRDAVRAAVNLEPQRDDAIVAHARTEIETYALRRVTGGSG